MDSHKISDSFPFEQKSEPKSHQRDKSRNTPEFNKLAKKRREKAKHDAKSKKANQKVARRRRK